MREDLCGVTDNDEVPGSSPGMRTGRKPTAWLPSGRERLFVIEQSEIEKYPRQYVESPGMRTLPGIDNNIMKKEIEATFLSVDKAAVREKLKTTGFKLEIPEYLMRRKTFDFPNVQPGHKKWARVRQESNKTTMTIKDIRGPGINDTYETELIVNDFDTASDFLETCGLKEAALQENMREVWSKENMEVTIDTWPGLNPFIEIESETEEIVRQTSNELGFDFKDALFGSIDFVYEKELGIPKETIITLPEITFSNPPKKNAT